MDEWICLFYMHYFRVLFIVYEHNCTKERVRVVHQNPYESLQKGTNYYI